MRLSDEHMHLRTLAATLAAMTLIAGPARAFAPAPYLAERPLEAATAPARAYRPVTDRVPAAAAKRWEHLAAQLGAVGAQWDEDTGVPLRAWGKGIAAPGAIADAGLAADAARRLLDENLALLAPGTSPADLSLLANVARNGVRTVVFQQRWRGYEVRGARVQFTFKRDRLIVVGSTALPQVRAGDGARPIAPAQARERAGAWITGAYHAAPTVGAVGAPLVLPLVRGPGHVEYRLVVPVDVALAAPTARWDVFVDAATGAPVARFQKLMFATGTVAYHVPVRWPGAEHADMPAVFATHTIATAATALAADQAGAITWSGTSPLMITPGLAGKYVAVTPRAGAIVAPSLIVNPDVTTVWDQSSIDTSDAQLDAYIHANVVKQYVRDHIDPGLAYLDEQLPVFVNENDTCNANSSGDDLHFFHAGDGCENTARISDVVYHEFGHSVHYHVLIGGGAPEGSLGEGQADYLAMTITNDSGLGRGFFFDNDPIREANPVGTELRWPDDLKGEVHADGMIFSSTMWDLRTALIAAYGEDAGIARADALYYGIIQRAADIPSTYVEALVEDDDDGDLANGTPNECLIQGEFLRHGLVPSDHTPIRAGDTITIPSTPTASTCPLPAVTGGTITWQLRGHPGSGGTVPLAASGGSFAGAIPPQPDGLVVQYKVDVTTADGATTTFPFNPADPLYEYFTGPVTPIKCWDFETEPTDWTHTATSGNDEWQWGAPHGTTTNTDPLTAFRGQNVYGTDLGQGAANNEGTYESRSNQIATTPVVDTTGFVGVRLQYRRWLGVEDGHFDHATVTVDGDRLWSNADSNQGDASNVHHRDREWRFQDVDLTTEAADGSVQVAFGLTSDPAFQLGGWTIDDVCIVGIVPTAPVCGDHVVTGGEACDDGNAAPGDGCSATCTIEVPADPDPPPDTGCCSTSGSPGSAAVGLALAAMLRRRRRVL
ncbi:MAG: hypothetical protein K8W52_17250 [Deltaproteobacteria bacterium]|nr:hypothetical protein [Deltaproteobacteria bacterium]